MFPKIEFFQFLKKQDRKLSDARGDTWAHTSPRHAHQWRLRQERKCVYVCVYVCVGVCLCVCVCLS